MKTPSSQASTCKPILLPLCVAILIALLWCRVPLRYAKHLLLGLQTQDENGVCV